MISYKTTVQMNRPLEQVFAFLVDPSKLTLWQSNLLRAEMLSDGPLRAGSRFREVRMLRGKKSEICGEVSALEPNRLLTTETLGQPQVRVRYELQTQGAGTRLSYEFTMQTRGLMWLLQPVIRSSIRKETESNFRRLKQLMDA